MRIRRIGKAMRIMKEKQSTQQKVKSEDSVGVSEKTEPKQAPSLVKHVTILQKHVTIVEKHVTILQKHVTVMKRYTPSKTTPAS